MISKSYNPIIDYLARSSDPIQIFSSFWNQNGDKMNWKSELDHTMEYPQYIYNQNLAPIYELNEIWSQIFKSGHFFPVPNTRVLQK